MKGIVVDHLEAGVRYATFEEYFDPEVHVKVRDLEPNEQVLGFPPERIDQTEPPADEPVDFTETEGSVFAGSEDE